MNDPTVNGPGASPSDARAPGRAAPIGFGGFAALTGFFAWVAFYAASPIFCTDFHWHLAIGRAIAERGEIPRVDLFSAVDPERAYVQFNWLWDLFAFLVHDAGGPPAIRALQAAWMVASFAALFVVVRRAVERTSGALFVCALALVLFEDRFRARPDALTLGFVACMLPLFARRDLGRGTLAATAALGVLWSNVHGGASILLPLSTGALAVGTMLDARFGAPDLTLPTPARRWALFAASALGVALSPTTLAGVGHWLGAIGPQIATGNEEWQPTWTMLRNGFAPSFVVIALAPSVVAVVYAVTEVRRVRRDGRGAVRFGEWLIAAGCLVLAHQAVRNAVLCVVPVVLLLARRRIDASSPPHAADASRGRAYALAAALLVVASAHALVIEGYGGVKSAIDLAGYDLAPDTYPEQAAAFLVEAGLEGGILNQGSWGGYLIWNAWPACHVFVDTRHHLTAEMWPVFLRSHDPLRRPEAMETAFLRWGVELAVFRGPTFPLVIAPSGWQLLYKAGEQEIYQRLGAVHADANLARAREALRRRGLDPGSATDGARLADAAARAGAAEWLAEPYQRRRAGRAHKALASTFPTEQARGHRIRGDLLFRAGNYRRAAADFERAAALVPSDVASRVRAALAHFALGRTTEVRDALSALRGADPSGLSPLQRGTVGLLTRAVGAR
jgi:hypothetical protein